MKPGLEQCPCCGAPTCYVQTFEDNTFTKMCMKCGFSTNSEMKEGTKVLETTLSKAPELYKDIIHTDQEGYKWIPVTIIEPTLGMVFVDGTNKEDWQWAAVKAINIPRSIRRKNGITKTHKMDMGSMQHFPSGDFSDACNYAGLFKVKRD